MEASNSRSQSVISGEVDKDVFRSDINVGNSETRNSSFQSLITDTQSWITDQGNTSDTPKDPSSPANQVDFQLTFFFSNFPPSVDLQ